MIFRRRPRRLRHFFLNLQDRRIRHTCRRFLACVLLGFCVQGTLIDLPIGQPPVAETVLARPIGRVCVWFAAMARCHDFSVEAQTTSALFPNLQDRRIRHTCRRFLACVLLGFCVQGTLIDLPIGQPPVAQTVLARPVGRVCVRFAAMARSHDFSAEAQTTSALFPNLQDRRIRHTCRRFLACVLLGFCVQGTLIDLPIGQPPVAQTVLARPKGRVCGLLQWREVMIFSAEAQTTSAPFFPNLQDRRIRLTCRRFLACVLLGFCVQGTLIDLPIRPTIRIFMWTKVMMLQWQIEEAKMSVSNTAVPVVATWSHLSYACPA